MKRKYSVKHLSNSKGFIIEKKKIQTFKILQNVKIIWIYINN